MYSIANNVLGTLKYDIAGGGLAIVVQPIAGTPFNLPPSPTDALVPTYGKPFGLLVIADRVDLSQAKYEVAIYSARAAEAAGAYTYTIVAGGRGWEGTAAQAWQAGAYILGIATENFLAGEMRAAVLRAEFLLVHKRDAVVKWDGANFTFDTYTCYGAGRGKHWGSDGYFTIAMPANGTVVKGFGGAADANVAAGAIPVAAKHALYFEPYISGPNATIAGNFRLVTVTADYSVPLHWILIAVHSEVVAGDKMLRLADGQTMTPWFNFGGGAPAPGFSGAWVDFAGGGYATSGMRKFNGEVQLRGLVKTGVINTVCVVLPAGWRPSASRLFAAVSNAAFGAVQVDANGNVTPSVGNNASVSLDTVRFIAEA